MLREVLTIGAGEVDRVSAEGISDCVGFLDSGPECSQQDLKAGPLDGRGKGGAPCSFECHGELLRRDVNKMVL